MKALLEAANRNNATMNEILRRQQAQGRTEAGGAGGIENMSQDEISNRVDQMLKNGNYEGLEDMDSDEFARLMEELAKDGSLEGLSQEEIAKRIEKLIQEGGYEGLEGLDSSELAKLAKNLSKDAAKEGTKGTKETASNKDSLQAMSQDEISSRVDQMLEGGD